MTRQMLSVEFTRRMMTLLGVDPRGINGEELCLRLKSGRVSDRWAAVRNATVVAIVRGERQSSEGRCLQPPS
jgi:hypothetical protein